MTLLWIVVGLARVTPAWAVVYVDAAATGHPDGSSWANARTNLQEALTNAKAGDEVWVAAGSYYPGLVGNRQATFQLRTNVRLYGGFGGGETNLNQRDPILHEVILSGDLNRDDEPGWIKSSDNSYHVVSGDNIDATAVLDGFTILGGYASESSGPHSYGAGVKLERSHPTIAHCRIQANFAQFGAAMYAYSSSPILSNCWFNNNLAQTGRGGAFYVTTASSPTVVHCGFDSNYAQGGVSACDGGAVYIGFNCPMTFADCTFANNRALTLGVNVATGGAVSTLSEGVTFVRCLFSGNAAAGGGAVWNSGRTTTFVNCGFWENTASIGGALLNFGGIATLAGCTLAANTATDGGGLASDLNGRALVRSCILWTNTADATTAFKAQVHNANGGSADFSYSCVQGLFTPELGEDPPNPINFPGCIDADPRLVDIKGRDFRLAPASPCIDAGDNSAFPLGTLVDLGGEPRFVDELTVPDTGIGTSPIADMGAYESTVVIGDKPYDQWRIQNFGDQANAPEAAEAADWDSDGFQNLMEYALARDPRVKDFRSVFTAVRVVTISSNQYLEVSYARRKALADADMNLELANDLTAPQWINDPGLFADERIADDANGMTETVTTRIKAPINAGIHQFVRLSVKRL